MRAFRLDSPDSYLRFHDLPGSGTPILFLHGLLCASSCDFPRIAADPALAGRRMLLVDLLGAGFSDRPGDFGYMAEDHAGTVTALLDGLALGSVDLVGHSMGGSIAIVTAARRPQVIRRLVVSEPNLDAGGGSFSLPVSRQSEADYVARGHAAEVRKLIADGQTILSASLERADPVAVHRGATSLVRGGSPSWRAQLEALPMPRTFIFGARSLPDPDSERLPRMGVEVRIVPDAGHSMIVENPSAYAEAVRAALA
jgi:pimeloyl-ACP methyl ester carboxylesterase